MIVRLFRFPTASCNGCPNIFVGYLNVDAEIAVTIFFAPKLSSNLSSVILYPLLCILHLSLDLPSILSGSQIGVIDPHEEYFTEGRNR